MLRLLANRTSCRFPLAVVRRRDSVMTWFLPMRTDGGEMLQVGLERQHPEQVLKEHGGHPDRGDRSSDAARDRNAVDAAAGRRRGIGDHHDAGRAGCSDSRTMSGAKLVRVDCAQSIWEGDRRPASRAARESKPAP